MHSAYIITMHKYIARNLVWWKRVMPLILGAQTGLISNAYFLIQLSKTYPRTATDANHRYLEVCSKNLRYLYLLDYLVMSLTFQLLYILVLNLIWINQPSLTLSSTLFCHWFWAWFSLLSRSIRLTGLRPAGVAAPYKRKQF